MTVSRRKLQRLAAQRPSAWTGNAAFPSGRYPRGPKAVHGARFAGLSLQRWGGRQTLRPYIDSAAELRPGCYGAEGADRAGRTRTAIEGPIDGAADCAPVGGARHAAGCRQWASLWRCSPRGLEDRSVELSMKGSSPGPRCVTQNSRTCRSLRSGKRRVLLRNGSAYAAMPGAPCERHPGARRKTRARRCCQCGANDARSEVPTACGTGTARKTPPAGRLLPKRKTVRTSQALLARRDGADAGGTHVAFTHTSPSRRSACCLRTPQEEGRAEVLENRDFSGMQRAPYGQTLVNRAFAAARRHAWAPRLGADAQAPMPDAARLWRRTPGAWCRTPDPARLPPNPRPCTAPRQPPR